MADGVFEGRCLEREVVFLFGTLSFGAASISSQTSLGFSVTRTGAGAYTVTLDKKYRRLLGCHMTHFEPGGAGEADGKWYVAGDLTNGTTFNVIRYQSSANTDPDTGDGLDIWIIVSSSAD